MMITQIVPLEYVKGKVQITLDSGEELVLYQGELQKLGLEEQMDISETLYEQIYHEIIGKRAKKRALHLLEKMDRTEEQLRRKLLESRYPKELTEEAIAYVKSYRYIDDERYARNFIRLNQEKRSAARMKADLLAKGVAPDVIERALEEELETQPEELIQKLLEKKALTQLRQRQRKQPGCTSIYCAEGFGTERSRTYASFESRTSNSQ